MLEALGLCSPEARFLLNFTNSTVFLCEQMTRHA